MKKLQRESYKKLKTKGIVIPTDWDEKGNVSAIVIATHNEEEYLVELNQKGRELLALIREPIKVTGILRTDRNSKIIEVEEYHLINK